MKIQYISDLHLEFITNPSKIPQIIPKAPILCLLGDIGNPKHKNYETFIANVSKQFCQVFVITGNHEYYSKYLSITETNELVQNICNKFNNVIFLNNSFCDIDEYRFIGTTLWSKIPNEKFATIEYSISDYSNIRDMTSEKNNNLFTNNLKFITDTIANSQDKKVILLSHHMPITNNEAINPKYHGHPINCAFMTDLSYLMKDPIKVWLCGHTHYKYKVNINGVIIANNAVGYKGELMNKIPDEDVIELL